MTLSNLSATEIGPGIWLIVAPGHFIWLVFRCGRALKIIAAFGYRK